MREQILEILNDVNDEIDYENSTSLIDDKVLSSFDIINILAQLQEEFDIEITPDDMTPENFNDLDSIVALVEKLA